MELFAVGILVGWWIPTIMSWTIGFGLVSHSIGSTMEHTWANPRWDWLSKTRLTILQLLRVVSVDRFRCGEFGPTGHAVWIVKER